MLTTSLRSLSRQGMAGLAAAVFSASALLLSAVPAQAALNAPATVSLLAPGGVIGNSAPISFEQGVVNLAAGIVAGDGSDIGDFMLPGEAIRFEGQSILLHVAAGGESNGDLVTGFLGLAGESARYAFSGLQVPGQVIVGLQAYAFDGYATSGTSGVISGMNAFLAGPQRVVFTLDELVFADRGTGSADAYGEFRIDLVTVPVPEPASFLFMLAGLAMVGAVLRRRHARQR